MKVMKARQFRSHQDTWDTIRRESKKKNSKLKKKNYTMSDYIRESLNEKFERENVKVKEDKNV